ncbi:hypothetical protein CEXT_106121 [Caerostris extrusa]|uniref:Uncharacterized protein n=1 Tax=Caerostris extrusa TaxID=172846 RepID=A0AAV4QIE2_CAEEX|nr:hypothetical protein CEXT_106121 [Caerostris extrusa]
MSYGHWRELTLLPQACEVPRSFSGVISLLWHPEPRRRSYAGPLQRRHTRNHPRRAAGSLQGTHAAPERDQSYHGQQVTCFYFVLSDSINVQCMDNEYLFNDDLEEEDNNLELLNIYDITSVLLFPIKCLIL